LTRRGRSGSNRRRWLLAGSTGSRSCFPIHTFLYSYAPPEAVVAPRSRDPIVAVRFASFRIGRCPGSRHSTTSWRSRITLRHFSTAWHGLHGGCRFPIGCSEKSTAGSMQVWAGKREVSGEYRDEPELDRWYTPRQRPLRSSSAARGRAIAWLSWSGSSTMTRRRPREGGAGSCAVRVDPSLSRR
jgi:hypothetical protein